jgi:hypothetical protein
MKKEVQMRLTTLCVVLGSVFFGTCGAMSAEIGRATVAGRLVVLDSNGTWAYADEASAASPQDATCASGNVIKSKKLPISICVTKPWRIDETAPGSMEMQVVQTELDLFVGLVTERTQMPVSTIRQAILANAASFAGIRAEDVATLKDTSETLNGVEWKYIEYEVVYSGAKFRFGNFHQSLGELGAVQVAFWSSAAYFDQNRSAINDFMNGVKLNVAK